MEPKPSAAVISCVPPYGHVLINAKWRGSTLVQHFKGNVKTVFEEQLGVVDLHLSNKSCILYVSESDLVAGNDYKRKIVRFRNANSNFCGIVVAEKTHLSEQYFSALQKFVVLELGLTLLHVPGPAEAAQLIAQMVHGESKENPFRRRSTARLLDPVVVNLVQQIPGVGKVKAMVLLQHFSSIHKICNVSVEELERVVGQATAQHIWAFFHDILP
ncbi:Fanconi anemia core complex-associated protein 24 [Tachysurus fulvidraco]|uniref:Fanconi anemia core complex-associated protein 24 n=1 Tax=Tachysurus fulvidraco TaxID=1234273 RepID=UPI000F4EA114|nr:Fanconi anemia core complex-associated protein 24 [Tachysurus fulvidraco]XP_026996725.1 Fanconi anemia core complex-associated protein 24 [Tachysurus fulvidraco]XP_047675404.1 Fanconi anemia core complex-associated protein 24 [Tachysurus fulvidraco]